MGAAAGEEAGLSSSGDADASEYRERPSSTNQLGDFSRIYEFLLGTPKSASISQRGFSADDGLTGRPPDFLEDTPTPVSKVAGRRRRTSQPMTTETNIFSSDFTSDTTIRTNIVKSTPRKKESGFAVLPPPPESHVQRDSQFTELVSSNTARRQLKALKSQLLKVKLLGEMDIDENAQKKVFNEKRLTHIFIDMSNIDIGFNNCYKAARRIPEYARTPRAPLDFWVLAQILQRGRAVGAREVVGSAADPENASDLPQYFHDAKSLSYETSILRRVLKPTKAGQGSSSPSNSPDGLSSSSESGEYCGISHREMAYREQGVDEILQLKMGNTAMAYLGRPGVIVLATGDAEKAEYSDGFQKQVERILKMGWIVEVVSWKRGLSYAWRRSKWAQKWGDQFRIILLDPFVEDLLAT